MHWMNIGLGFLLVSIGALLWFKEGSEPKRKTGPETFRGQTLRIEAPVNFSPSSEALIIKFLAEDAEAALRAANEPIE